MKFVVTYEDEPMREWVICVDEERGSWVVSPPTREEGLDSVKKFLWDFFEFMKFRNDEFIN